MKVKAGSKVHTGKVVGSGTKSDMERMITEFEALEGDGESDDEQQEKVKEKSGEIDCLVTITKILHFLCVVSLLFTCIQ